jgi:hypothetical protein
MTPRRAKAHADLAFLGAHSALLAFLRILGEPQSPAGGVTLLDDHGEFAAIDVRFRLGPTPHATVLSHKWVSLHCRLRLDVAGSLRSLVMDTTVLRSSAGGVERLVYRRAVRTHMYQTHGLLLTEE